MSEEDFIVGYTLFKSGDFRTKYQHFNNLETAKMFTSNVNLKDNSKIYVPLDLYNKQQKELENDYISKDKIKERLEKLKEKEQELSDEQGYWGGSELQARIEELEELLEE